MEHELTVIPFSMNNGKTNLIVDINITDSHTNLNECDHLAQIWWNLSF